MAKITVKKTFDRIWCEHNDLYKKINKEANRISKDILKQDYYKKLYNKEYARSVNIGGVFVMEIKNKIKHSMPEIIIKLEQVERSKACPPFSYSFVLCAATILNGLAINQAAGSFAMWAPSDTEWEKYTETDLLYLGMRAEQIETSWKIVKANLGEIEKLYAAHDMKF